MDMDINTVEGATVKGMEFLSQTDKHLHFAAGFFTLLLVWVLSGRPDIAMAVVTFFGGAKEAVDQAKGGKFDWWDWIFTGAGGVLALAVLFRLGAV